MIVLGHIIIKDVMTHHAEESTALSLAVPNHPSDQLQMMSLIGPDMTITPELVNENETKRLHSERKRKRKREREREAGSEIEREAKQNHIISQWD